VCVVSENRALKGHPELQRGKRNEHSPNDKAGSNREENLPPKRRRSTSQQNITTDLEEENGTRLSRASAQRRVYFPGSIRVCNFLGS
jgi:hypothetical protein